MDKYSEINYMLDTGEIPLDLERQEFCEILKNKYKLNVSYICDVRWANIVDLELYLTKCEKKFLELIIKTRGRFNVADMGKLSPTFFPKSYNFLSDFDKKIISQRNDESVAPPFAVDLAHEIIEEYYAFTKKPQDVLTIANFLPFEKSMLEFVYARSQEPLRNKLGGEKEITRFYIISRQMFGATVAVVLPHEKYVLINRKSQLLQELKHDCFLITKEQDKLGFLNEDDYAIEFYDESISSPTMIGVDPRDWLY